jgi:predicted nucleotidyltransferase
MMHPAIAEKQQALAELCRRYGVVRLDLFGSAARGDDFDPDHSDADFLVDLDPVPDLSPLQQYLGLAAALEKLLGRPVDLVERCAIEQSRNYIRRHAILKGAERVFG